MPCTHATPRMCPACARGRSSARHVAASWQWAQEGPAAQGQAQRHPTHVAVTHVAGRQRGRDGPRALPAARPLPPQRCSCACLEGGLLSKRCRGDAAAAAAGPGKHHLCGGARAFAARCAARSPRRAWCTASAQGPKGARRARGGSGRRCNCHPGGTSCHPSPVPLGELGVLLLRERPLLHAAGAGPTGWQIRVRSTARTWAVCPMMRTRTLNGQQPVAERPGNAYLPSQVQQRQPAQAQLHGRLPARLDGSCSNSRRTAAQLHASMLA